MLDIIKLALYIMVFRYVHDSCVDGIKAVC